MKNFLLYFLVVYCFTFGILGREIGGMSYGILIEVFIVILWITVLVSAPREDWKGAGGDLFFLFLIWFIISIVEVINPGASLDGWFQEIRSAALYPFLIIPLGFVIFKNNRQLDVFLIIIIGMSTIAAINGIKQLYIGPSRGEQMFLDQGGAITHILWGRLRVFSFYSDAGQFGASQADIGVVALILATMGPFKKWKRIVLFICSLLMLYGMLISGTRGALFALVIGAFIAIILSKKFKVLIIGGILMVGFLCFLKFTHIGSGNYQIYRLRSAVNPEDASLNVRFNTQRALREYMSTRPFGGGLGVIGANGWKYNASNYLSTVQPDSYFVKIWAMYGIVGLTIWICIMLYIMGKCCGISLKITDEALRVKMIALTAGCGGILFCSYGNEVINTMPSSIVVYLSWVFVFISPTLEKAAKSTLLN
jgi:O-antigen ligase